MTSTASQQRRRLRRVGAAVACAAVAVTTSGTVGAAGATASPALTTLFAESFAGSTTAQPSWIMPTSGAWNQACLTAGDASATPIPGCASPALDATGNGALRLTPSTYGAVGTAYYDAGLPTAHGVDVTFNTYQWELNGGHAGDGISFILAATDPTNPTAPNTVGPSGGALGYTGSGGSPGVQHGYLGFGLDTVGGFGSTSVGDPSCPASTGGEQTVAVRGPGDGTSGYCVLGVQASDGALDAPAAMARPSAVPVEVALNPADTAQTSRGGDLVPAHSWLVSWTSYSGTPQTLSGALPTTTDLQAANIPAGWYDPTTSLPYQLSFGWAGSTGAWQEIHEVSDVQATTLGGALPMYGLRMGDDSAGTFASDGTGTITVTPSLSADGGDETRPATVTTTLPDGLNPTNPISGDYNCTTTGQVVSCTTTAAGVVTAGSDLPALAIPVTGSPAQIGNQTVTAKVSSTDGNPAVSSRQVAVRLPQAVSITSTPTGTPRPGGSYQLSATGGGSGNPVTFSIDPATTNTACSLSGDTVTFAHGGDCVIDANQAGNDAYLAAPQVQQSVTVDRKSTSVALTLPATTSVYGAPATVTATVTSEDPVDGTVQFTVDGAPLGSAVSPGSNGEVASPAMTDGTGNALTAGAHQIGAAFAPTDSTAYAGSAAAPQTLTVDKAATTSSLSVHPRSLSATVSVVAPGAGTPTGTVTFTVDGTSVGSAPLVTGVATLPYATRAGQTRHVAALYSGDGNHVASSLSLARHNPNLTAHLSSAHPRNRYGWYRTPVTVKFICATNGAALTKACPQPVTLRRSGAAQSVARTITADDGGMATVTVRGIDIDRTSPQAHLSGVTRAGHYFAGAPEGHCKATDQTSGVAGCTLHHHRSGSTETITARAVDKAGNAHTTSVTVHLVRFMLTKPGQHHSVHTVRRGHTYTLLAQSASRPSYIDAAVYPRRPHGNDNYLHPTGHHRWAIGVTFESHMRANTFWNIGVKTGHAVHVLKVYVRR